MMHCRRRAHSLQLRKPLHVGQLAGQVAASHLALVGVEGAPHISRVLAEQREALAQAAQPAAQPCMLLVGPEGDFSPQELDDIIAAGARPVGLGPNRLRVETAALAMLTAVTLWQADS
jgi:16S rRNA (uracil1498-N3)-methyltransferase